jgi:hypothetical protein
MRYERQIAQFLVVAYCGEDLAIQVSSLFSVLERLHRQGPPLYPGISVRFGWSRLLLEGDNNTLTVCEPDFDGDPFSRVVPEIDRTLRVVSEQAGVCRLAGAVGADVSFDQTIVIGSGQITAPKIYLDRRQPEVADFSGWYLGSSEENAAVPNDDPLEPIYLFELLKFRPAVLKVLTLPVNYMATFSGDDIELIFDSSGTAVWSRSTLQAYRKGKGMICL